LRERYRFGPARITSYLHRFHNMDVARSTVHRILIRYGMNRLPANQKRQPTGRPWHRYEKPQPGHRLQIDVKFLERIAGSRKRLYQFTAIDDCTRIRVLKIYDVCNQKSAISFVDEVRGGVGFSDRGISNGFRAGHNRRNEVHEEAQT
jgi:hypothetical protein